MPSFRTVVVWLASTVAMAGVGMTFAGELGISPASEGEPIMAPTLCPSPTSVDGALPTEEATPPADVEMCPSPSLEPSPDLQAEPAADPAADPAREAACLEAAGLPPGGSTQGSDGIELPHGLERSTEVLLANCVKNPQAKGLLVALRRHAEHRARLAEKRAERAEKAAARAERRVSKGSKKADRAASGRPSGGGKSGGSPKH